MQTESDETRAKSRRTTKQVDRRGGDYTQTMSRQEPLPQWANIELPPWFWAGRHEGFFTAAKLRARSTNSAKWRLATTEAYHRTTPGLIGSVFLIGHGEKSHIDAIEEAARAGRCIEIEDGLSLSSISPPADRDLAATLAWWQLQMMSAEPSQLPGVLTQIHKGLGMMVTEGTEEKVFPDAQVYAAEVSPAFGYRMKLASALLRVQYDKGFMVGGAKTPSQSGTGSQFASAEGLLEGGALYDCFFSPLMGALTPSIWALFARTRYAPVVVNLGRTIAGTKRLAAEPIQTLPSRGASVRTWPGPITASGAFRSAFEWWVRRLDSLFGTMTNLALFADSSENYVASKHHQALLTVEQLFRRTSSIQSSVRDVHTQRVLLFTVLDTLEKLTGKPIEKLCSHSFATKTLDRARTSLPEDSGKVLLPSAERAVAALKGVQKGFFIDPLRAANEAGEPIQDLDLAAALYIKALRNATHGHGSNRERKKEQTNILIAHHDGRVPDDLPLLAYLYLLDLLNNPENLARRLYRGGSD